MKRYNEKKLTSQTTADTQLLAVCAEKSAGWEIALADWLNSQSDWLHRRCVFLLGNQTDAEDAVQEVMLKVVRAIDQFESRSSLRTWVARITDNTCYTLIKQRSARAMGTHLQHSIALHEMSRLGDTSSADDDSETVATVRSTLESMTENNRTVLELRFFRELSLEQMASTLDLSLSATKMRLYRAMDAFKKIHLISGFQEM